MYKIFNSESLSRNSRFIRGLVAGSVTALILALAYGVLSSFLFIEFSLAFIGIGYLIGMAIRHFGHGVKIEFAIMGAALTFICIMLADFIAFFGFENFLNFSAYPNLFAIYSRMLFRTEINSLLSLAFRAAGVYAGYMYSRIV